MPKALSLAVNEHITSGGVKLDVEVLPEATPKQVRDAVDNVCKVLHQGSMVVERVTLVLGRLLVVVNERKLFKPDHKSFDKYVTTQVLDRYGFGRSTVYNAIKVARTLGNKLTPERYEQIGSTNLLLASRAVVNKPEAEAVVDKLIAAPKPPTGQEFRQALQVFLPQRETSQQAIVVRVPQTTISQWQALTTNPAVQEAAGGATPSSIFVWMLKEFLKLEPALRKGAKGAGRKGVRGAAEAPSAAA